MGGLNKHPNLGSDCYTRILGDSTPSHHPCQHSLDERSPAEEDTNTLWSRQGRCWVERYNDRESGRRARGPRSSQAIGGDMCTCTNP